MLVSDLSVDRISGEGSLRGASPFYRVSPWVAIDHERVKGVVVCVQDFVRHPLFTQRNFFSVTGMSMLNTAVTAEDAVHHSSKFDPRGAIGVDAGRVIADLKSCREKFVSGRRAVKDTRRVGLVQKLLHHQLLVRLCPARLSASLMSLRYEMCSMLRSTISLVSFVAVDLCQFQGRIRRGECQ